MDTTNSITFTSKLTFWDKFKCFYLLHLCSLIFLSLTLGYELRNINVWNFRASK
jgi:hypothetical protein